MINSPDVGERRPHRWGVNARTFVNAFGSLRCFPARPVGPWASEIEKVDCQRRACRFVDSDLSGP
nr:hypothetical protein Iba_chr03bCG16700 [Ipomoea batatas]GME16611.1 hypothetical protein Iba_scaffold17801CG0010 [Ipomoea batatas]GME20679.1 hypothetical protein Iba_scaffold25830CG0010 [Ipomoea batatas]